MGNTLVSFKALTRGPNHALSAVYEMEERMRFALLAREALPNLTQKKRDE